MRTMTIRQYGNTFTSAEIPFPTFGYSVELRLALSIQKVAQGVGAFDRGKQYDQRRCSFDIQATEAQIIALRGILESERRNQHNRFVLTLPQGSGFFLAGADKGDSGEFVFSFLENVNFSAMKLSPYGFFDVSFRILIHDSPTILVPQAPRDLSGHFTFGNITGIRDPQIKPTQMGGSLRKATLGGETQVAWTPTDEQRTDLAITTTTGKMAELANYLQNGARGGLFTVTPGSKYWLWGGQADEDDAANVRLLSANFLMTHADYDLWTVPVQLWREVELGAPPAPIPQNALTVTANNAYGASGVIRVNGSAQSLPSTTYHNRGDLVTISAEADAGSVFTGWSGASGSTDAEIRLAMGESNITLTANFATAYVGLVFAALNYQGDAGILRNYLVATINGNTVSLLPDNSLIVSMGDSVMLTFTPQPPFVSGYWYGHVNGDPVQTAATSPSIINFVVSGGTALTLFGVGGA